MLTTDKYSGNATIRLIFQTLLLLMTLLTTCSMALAKGAKGKPPSRDVCGYVLEAANQNQLGSILVSSEPDGSTRIKVPDADNGSGISDYGVVFKQHLDINNDGKPERVFVTSEGSLQVKQLYIFHAKKDTPIELHNQADEDPEQWESDIDFVNFRGTTYLLARNGLSLAYVAYIDPTNETRSVCRYGQKENSFRKIISSSDKNLCNRYLSEEPQPVEYDKPHSVTDEILAAGEMHGVSPGEEAALLDINNDGSARLVVSLEEHTSNFCGSLEYPAVLSSDGTSLDPEFARYLPEKECLSSIFPFVDHGKTYLGTADYQYNDDSELKLRKIEMLERGILKKLCEYEVRPVNYLLPPEQELMQAAPRTVISGVRRSPGPVPMPSKP